MNCSSRSCAIASSVSVPPSTSGISWLAVALELRLEVAGRQRRAPAELDQIDERAGDLDQPLDLGHRQTAVEHVGDTLLAGLGAPSREVEKVRHAAWRLLRGREVAAEGDDHVGRARRRAAGTPAPAWSGRPAGTLGGRGSAPWPPSNASRRWPGHVRDLVEVRVWSAAVATFPACSRLSTSLVRDRPASPGVAVPLRTATVTEVGLERRTALA